MSELLSVPYFVVKNSKEGWGNIFDSVGFYYIKWAKCLYLNVSLVLLAECFPLLLNRNCALNI